MKTKLEMAHEWYMKYSESPSFMNTEVEMAWQYADAMQAEADKREDKTKSELSWIRALELVSDLGIEYVKYLLEDDDVTEFEIHSNGECEGYTGVILADDLKRIIDIHEVMEGCGEEEWQPDWSQAPKNMNYFFVNKDGSKFWTINEPDKPNLTEHVMNFSDCGGDCYAYASLQDYQGDWRDSLRKRPK